MGVLDREIEKLEIAKLEINFVIAPFVFDTDSYEMQIAMRSASARSTPPVSRNIPRLQQESETWV